MPHLFRGCLALVSTSSQEGFPNTFLQAGKYRVPVVSLIVDPDEMLWSRRKGIVCHGNLDVMADAVADLASNPERRNVYAAPPGELCRRPSRTSGTLQRAVGRHPPDDPRR